MSSKSILRWAAAAAVIACAPFGMSADDPGPSEATTVLINELSAGEDPRFVDEDGDAVDWVEIWNRGTETVSLAGWHLTDDADTPEKWTFPNIDLASGDFLVVYASGKDRAEPLHTNFKLDEGGEYLALLRPDGSVSHAFETEFPKQRAGMSYGLQESGTFRFFATPTRGSANVGRGLCYVADTKFSVNRGFYEAPFTVEITCDTPDAVIRYTTDGNEPFVGTLFGGAKGTIYTGPITIDSTTVLRAYATRSGWEPSNIDTQTYLFLKDVLRQSPNGEVPPGWPAGSVNGQQFDFGMDPEVVDAPAYADEMLAALRDIPSMSLVLDHDDLTDARHGIYTHASEDGRTWERPGSLELLNPDGEPGFHINAGVRIRGGFSRTNGNPKHSFRMFFRDDYGDSALRFPLFGDDGAKAFKKFDFRTAQNYAWSLNSSNDARRNTFLREIFARDSQRAMGQPHTRSQYYHLYLNGLYWGLYMTQERSTDDYAASYFGGEPEDYDVIKVEAGPYTVFATEGTIDAYEQLHTLVSGDLSDADFYALQGKNPRGEEDLSLTKHIDVENLIDYMLIIFYVGSFDAPLAGTDRANNFYAIRNREARDGWRFFSHDTEHSMLSVSENRMGPYPAGRQKQHFNPQYLHQQLMQSDAYRLQFADHVQKHFFHGGVFTVEGAQKRWQERQDQIKSAILGESARWGDQHETRPYTREHWTTETDWVRNTFLPARTGIVFSQLKNVGLTGDLATPVFSPHGGIVSDANVFTFKVSVGTLFNPQPGELYYTTDGSDPMMPDGSVAPTATLYDRNGVNLTETATVRVRIVNEGRWSPINEAKFIVGGVLATTENLVISEIMFNPSDPLAGSAYPDASSYEFLELWNPSENTVDLTGAHFQNGLNFVFPASTLAPGERVLIVHTLAAFEERYGNTLPVVGVYGGEEGSQLSNSGERLTLMNIHKEVIADFSYGDGKAWPEMADGGGASLVRDDPSSDASDASSWRASPESQGSPGAASGPLISTGYAEWKVSNGLEDDLADPDEDGLNNFLEYATGGDPKAPTPLSPVAIAREANGTLILGVVQALAAIDVEISLESSEDLMTWTALVQKTALDDVSLTATQTQRRWWTVPEASALSYRARYRLAE